MNKLIKLSDTHYIVVDDSEIKNKEAFLDMRDYPNNISDYDIYWAGSGGSIEFSNTIGKKITHSFGKQLAGVINKPLSEVEEAIYGYNIMEMSINAVGNSYSSVWRTGFKAHQELVKDKVSLSDVFKVLDLHTDDAPISYLKRELEKMLSPKTEWLIKFDEQSKIKIL